jgi:hypothetical protein
MRVVRSVRPDAIRRPVLAAHVLASPRLGTRANRFAGRFIPASKFVFSEPLPQE